MHGVQLIDSGLLEALVTRAQQSPRLRSNHNFHRDAADNPHRFLNALARGTYCCPHRHLDPPKAESFVALTGEVAVFLFDDSGKISGQHVLGHNGLFGIDIAPGLWHAIAALSETAVCFEVKPGPYQVTNDKQFADFAPPEGDPRAPAYLAELISKLRA
jgi:cupin fold WbuC family metalloprotein